MLNAIRTWAKNIELKLTQKQGDKTDAFYVENYVETTA